jgi:hypothetical protein
MNKIRYITLMFWLISLIIGAYNFIVKTGYWGKPLLWSMFFYVVTVIISRGFNKTLVFIAILYVGIGFFLIFYILVGIGSVLGG